MNRILLAVLALALAPLAGAQLYKYTDKDGKTVYSDQPPPGQESKQLNIHSGTTSPAKSYVDRDKELEKARKETREASKKGEQTTKAAQAAEERCNAAKTNYRVYEEGGRVAKRTASGERVLLDDKELEAEREKARAVMEEACKKS